MLFRSQETENQPSNRSSISAGAMLRRTGLRERWRPADEAVGSDVCRGDVGACVHRRGSHDVRSRGGGRRREDDEQPRGAEVALQDLKIRHRISPDCPLSGVHARCVVGSFGAIGGLLRRVLHLMEGRTGHPTHGKRHEQEPSQNGAALWHGPIGN